VDVQGGGRAHRGRRGTGARDPRRGRRQVSGQRCRQLEFACFEATAGHRGQALKRLREATAREPDLAAAAREDEDFESLRDDPEFADIVT
jgi:hypothetical protein